MHEWPLRRNSYYASAAFVLHLYLFYVCLQNVTTTTATATTTVTAATVAVCVYSRFMCLQTATTNQPQNTT